MMTVKKISDITGVTSDTIRYYTKIGLLIPERHPMNKYKIFTKEHVKLLGFIQQAKSLGLSLEEIQGVLHDKKKNRSSHQRVIKVVEKRIIENQRKIQELIALQNRMEKALNKWGDIPDAETQEDSFCYLIESVSESV